LFSYFFRNRDLCSGSKV